MLKQRQGSWCPQPSFETGISWIQTEIIFILDKLLGFDSISKGSLGTVDGEKVESCSSSSLYGHSIISEKNMKK